MMTEALFAKYYSYTFNPRGFRPDLALLLLILSKWSKMPKNTNRLVVVAPYPLKVVEDAKEP